MILHTHVLTAHLCTKRSQSRSSISDLGGDRVSVGGPPSAPSRCCVVYQSANNTTREQAPKQSHDLQPYSHLRLSLSQHVVDSWHGVRQCRPGFSVCRLCAINYLIEQAPGSCKFVLVTGLSRRGSRRNQYVLNVQCAANVDESSPRRFHRNETYRFPNR